MRGVAGIVRPIVALAVVSVVVLATAGTTPRNEPVAVASQPHDHPVARPSAAAPGGDPTVAVDPTQTTSVVRTASVAPASSVVAADHDPREEPGGLDTFLVGDSSMVEASRVTGVGSAYSGHGYTDEAALGVQNPLLAPADDYEGLVVLGVSLWDVHATDLSGYREATDRYRSPTTSDATCSHGRCATSRRTAR